ncbi:serine hydrolase [Pannonibacter sp. P2PFMT1]|uniref:serine hydrolase domain-containing protein n=1 Tax=Pannonibacter sp. P2PFMT1 TaxID=2003582 RepID=UPI0016464C11|nr:serine hydrolase domain-containing protein [Pannonibacter sp. P2PFMT1]
MLRPIVPFTVAGVLAACTAVSIDPPGRAPVQCQDAHPYRGPKVFSPAIALPLKMAAQPKETLKAQQAARFEKSLDLALDRSEAEALHAAVLLPGKGIWHGERGAAAQPLAHWASVGKAFTAAVIMQLWQENKLSLESPVSLWIDGVPNGDVITIRHLLNHTSGLFSANEDPGYRQNPRVLSLQDELVILTAHGPLFCPGASWRYSNSNYVLLGAIAEHIEGRSYDEIVVRRITRPLGLKHTRIATPRDSLADVTPAAAPGPTDIPADPRRAGAAGGVVAPASEMVLFWQALLEGRLFGPVQLREMFSELYSMFGKPEYYGLGIMAYTLPNRLLIGHSGGGAGLRAAVLYDPTANAFVAVSISGNKGAEATANLLLQSL